MIIVKAPQIKTELVEVNVYGKRTHFVGKSELSEAIIDFGPLTVQQDDEFESVIDSGLELKNVRARFRDGDFGNSNIWSCYVESMRVL